MKKCQRMDFLKQIPISCSSWDTRPSRRSSKVLPTLQPTKSNHYKTSIFPSNSHNDSKHQLANHRVNKYPRGVSGTAHRSVSGCFGSLNPTPQSPFSRTERKRREVFHCLSWTRDPFFGTQ